MGSSKLRASLPSVGRGDGVGPFFVSEFDMDIFSFIEYRGGTSELSLKVAVAHAGNLQI